MWSSQAHRRCCKTEIFKAGPILGLLSVSGCVCVSVCLCVCLSPLNPTIGIRGVWGERIVHQPGPKERRRKSLGTRSLHRNQMTPLLKEYFTSVLYYTILYYTKVSRDCSNIEEDIIIWYSIFWSSMNANSILVNNISVALSVFKWGSQIFLLCLG